MPSCHTSLLVRANAGEALNSIKRLLGFHFGGGVLFVCLFLRFALSGSYCWAQTSPSVNLDLCLGRCKGGETEESARQRHKNNEERLCQKGRDLWLACKKN